MYKKIKETLADDEVSFDKMDQAEQDLKSLKATLDKDSKEVFYAQHSGQVSANQQIQQSKTRSTWVV